MAEIKGLIVAIPTPFDASGRVDTGYVAHYLDYLRARGVDGVVVCGTTGEGPSLSVVEREILFRTVAQHRGDLSVIAGVGCASLPETIELTNAARDLGADAALIVPPFFFKNVPTEGLYDYYAAIFRATDIPVILYNIPSQSAIEIRHDLLTKLLEFPRLLGIKDTSGKPDVTAALCAGFSTLRIFCGDDRLLHELTNAPLAGAISGLASCFPELIAETMAACSLKTGREPQSKVNRVAAIINKYPPIAANKHVLAIKGFQLTHVRPPLVDLSCQEKEALERELWSERLI